MRAIGGRRPTAGIHVDHEHLRLRPIAPLERADTAKLDIKEAERRMRERAERMWQLPIGAQRD